MPGQARLGDQSKVDADSHGCLACAHTCIGPAVQGSEDVFVNGLPALRRDDPGVHSSCCGPNTWKAMVGSGTVAINGKPAHRKGDDVQHCGGIGRMMEASGDVFVGGPKSKSVAGKKPGDPPPPPMSKIDFVLMTEGGDPLPDEPVVLLHSSEGMIEATSDGSGRVLVENVPEGTYSVMAENARSIWNLDKPE